MLEDLDPESLEKMMQLFFEHVSNGWRKSSQLPFWSDWGEFFFCTHPELIVFELTLVKLEVILLMEEIPNNHLGCMKPRK